ncbi:MAG: hypothetical protein V9H69_19310 [Anaerolineae bacterium]
MLHLPDGTRMPLKVRSHGRACMPLFAVETLEPSCWSKLPAFASRLEWFLNYRPDLLAERRLAGPSRATTNCRLLSLLPPASAEAALLQRMLDADEFLSRLRRARAVARTTATHPYVFDCRRPDASSVNYQPAESDSRPVRRQLQLARADLVPGQLS